MTYHTKKIGFLNEYVGRCEYFLIKYEYEPVRHYIQGGSCVIICKYSYTHSFSRDKCTLKVYLPSIGPLCSRRTLHIHIRSAAEFTISLRISSSGSREQENEKEKGSVGAGQMAAILPALHNPSKWSKLHRVTYLLDKLHNY